jgi:acetylornithine deacetylase/succinyl-diaminopimelate desuccinylase-like protein
VQIPSVTPVQAGPRAGTPGEARIAAQIAAWFQQFGAEVVLDPVHPGRPSVYGLWRGTTERWVALDVHTDTVGVEQMTRDPFDGEIRDGKVWGRGAVDTKASLGAALAVMEALHAQGRRPTPSVLIGATVDEEFGATGAPAFAKWIAEQPFTVDQMIVAEPTRCTPVYGHRGVARFELTFHGKSAHSSQPDLGSNAVIAAARTVLAYADEHARLTALPPVELGHAALTSTVIHGGTGINVVPDSCLLLVDRRIVDGERATQVIDALYQIAQQAAALPIDIVRLRELDAFLQPATSPWLRTLVEWTGNQPEVAPYGTNAWAYVPLPGEKVVLGPGSIDQAHGAEEWVEIAELEKIAQVYARWWGLEG